VEKVTVPVAFARRTGDGVSGEDEQELATSVGERQRDDAFE
jgi:hypothetical protein